VLSHVQPLQAYKQRDTSQQITTRPLKTTRLAARVDASSVSNSHSAKRVWHKRAVLHNQE
jgi:hypothetical protein